MFNNNNNLILGPTRSLQWKGDLLERSFHPHLVGGIIENICTIPIPAIPPYDVRTLHIRGIWTTEANNPTTGVITGGNRAFKMLGSAEA